jgi:hypothetical protein
MYSSADENSVDALEENNVMNEKRLSEFILFACRCSSLFSQALIVQSTQPTNEDETCRRRMSKYFRFKIVILVCTNNVIVTCSLLQTCKYSSSDFIRCIVRLENDRKNLTAKGIETKNDGLSTRITNSKRSLSTREHSFVRVEKETAQC